jgi:hypothetical protein
MPIGNLLDDCVTGVVRAVEGEPVVITENNSVGGGFAQVTEHSLSSTHMLLCGMHEVLGEEMYVWLLLYGWTGQRSGSGFSDLAPSILHYNWF